MKWNPCVVIVESAVSLEKEGAAVAKEDFLVHVVKSDLWISNNNFKNIHTLWASKSTKNLAKGI